MPTYEKVGNKVRITKLNEPTVIDVEEDVIRTELAHIPDRKAEAQALHDAACERETELMDILKEF